MQLLELALQNARGFSPSARCALKPGYAVLKPPGETGAALGALLCAVLYADGRGSDAAFLAAGQTQGAVRVTFVGNDGQTYRLTRALGGAGILEKLDPATRGAARISQDSNEINQYLRAQAGLPTRRAFELLCTFSMAGMPSRTCKPKATAAAAPVAAPLLANALVAPAEDVGAARARLAALEKEKATSAQIEKVQFKVDGLASEIYELEGALKSTTGLEAAIDEAQKAYDAAPTIESTGLPADILERARKLPASLTRRDEALAKIAAEREAEQAAPSTSIPPLTSDQRFWLGIGLGAATLVGGALADGLVRYVSLLDIPAFGFSAVLALQYVDELKDASKVRNRGDRLAERERKVNEQYEQEAAPVRAAMKAVGVETPDELANLLGRREAYGQRLQELQADLDAAKAKPEYVAASTKLGRLRTDHEQLTAQLKQLGSSFVRDVSEVDREIERVKQSIALAGAPRAAAAATPAGASGEEVEDPFPALLSEAADLLRVDVPTLVVQLRDRIAQYVTALSERRYAGVTFDKDGRGTAVGPRGPQGAGTVGPKDLDLLFLAVRLTIAERVVAACKLPVFVDDAVSALDGRLHPLLAKMLKQLGAVTQVLHTTGHAGFVQLADLNAAL